MELVAEAERREREEQLFEEKRQIELMEKSRLQRIHAHFEKVNADLDSLHKYQVEEIIARHLLAFVRLQTTLKGNQDGREELANDLLNTRAEKEKALELVKEEQAREVKEIFARHCRDQAQLILNFEQLKSPLDDSAQAFRSQELLNEQQKERETAEQQYQRRIDKLQARVETVKTLNFYRPRKEKLDREVTSILRGVGQLCDNIMADHRWIFLAATEHKALLDDIEQYAIDSGADRGAPSSDDDNALSDAISHSKSSSLPTQEVIKSNATTSAHLGKEDDFQLSRFQYHFSVSSAEGPVVAESSAQGARRAQREHVIARYATNRMLI